MEKIIEELMRIELSARASVEEALTCKDTLKAKIAENAEEETRRAESEADAEIKRAREKALAETEEQLARIRVNSQKWFSSLERQYALNHRIWENEIFNAVVKA